VTTVDRRAHLLATSFLLDYRLSPEERRQETEALAQVIQTAVEAQLEGLAHRLIA
jgi:hypothetical protein